MSKISVVIITKNEEGKIRRCLESVKWTDKIVIVDDCSTDNTVRICRDFGAKVIIHKSDFNFDRQRNLGIDNASGDWVLQMDADEIVPFDLKEEILQAINNPAEFVAYEFRRKNCFLGHFLICDSQTYGVKLFRRDKARYIGSIHETLKVNGPIGRIQAFIEHYNFSSIFQFIQRQNLYTEQEARVMLKTRGGLRKKRDYLQFKKKATKIISRVLL